MATGKTSIEKSVAKGAAWLILLRISVKGIGFISTLVLVRILTPEDFGLVAIAMSLFAFIDIFSSFGFDNVIIQKQNASKVHYDTAWSFNFLFGIISCLLTIFLSFPVAKFYGNQKLQPVLSVVSLLFLLYGIRNIGVVDFQKKLDFDKDFKFQFIPKIVSFVVTITLAIWLRNYWALVIGTLTNNGTVIFLSYLMHDYRPKLTFSAWRELFHFSKWLMLNNFLFYLNTKSPEMIIGRMISPQAAGYFSISQEISTLPTTELATTLNRATFPGYSKISSDLEKLKKLYMQVVSSIYLLSAPAAMGIFAVTDQLVNVVLGSQWKETTMLMRYLSLGGLLFALNSNTGFVFFAIGRPRISTIINFIRALIFFPLLFILGNIYGLEGCALAALITSTITFFIYNITVHLKLNISFSELIKVYQNPLISSIMMVISVRFLHTILNNYYVISDVTKLILCIIWGAFVYFFFIAIMFYISGRPEGLEYTVWNFVRSRLSFIGSK